MINNIVGSANNKLENDITMVHSDRKIGARIASYLFSSNLNQSNRTIDQVKLAPKHIDFKLVKISCKKEMTIPPIDKKAEELKLIFKAFLVILLSTFLILTIYWVAFSNTSLSSLRLKRSVNIYSLDSSKEWSNENIPSFYELDITSLMNKELKVHNQTTKKLDFIKNHLRINCIQIKNINKVYNLKFERLLNRNLEINELEGLRDLIQIIHDMSMRVVLELQFEVGILISDGLFSNENSDIFYKNDKKVSKDWEYNEKFQAFYFTKYHNKKFAYFNTSSLKVQEAYLNQFRLFCSHLELDGIYLKNFTEIVHNNTAELKNFISKIQSIEYETAQLPVFALIGDYSSDSSIYNLFDFFRVSLNVTHVFDSIQNSAFNYYDIYSRVNQRKKIIWSIDDWKGASDELVRKMFFFIYAIPGFAMVDQNIQFNSTNSKFFKVFNNVIKPKLNDFNSEQPFPTSTQKYRLRGPEPFRGSSESLIREYLDQDLNYQFTIVFKSVLLIKRQINNYRVRSNSDMRFYSASFYRNIYFMINFTKFNIPIDLIFKEASGIKLTQARQFSQNQFHVLYDSQMKLPEFLNVNGMNRFEDYRLNSGEYLALEF